MKICFFNDINFTGGGELWVIRACHYLNSLNHYAAVICPHRSALQIACQREGIDVFSYTHPAREGYPFYEALFNFLNENKIDIIYCTVMGNFCESVTLETLAERLYKKTKQPKTAVILKTGLPPMGNLAPEYYGVGAGHFVRRLHVVSESIKKDFIDWEPKIDNGFIDVFYEGIDHSRFNGNGYNKKEAKERLHIPADHKVITCLARLEEMKGQSVLLRAIPEILKDHQNIHFLFAGEGGSKELLKELRDDLGLGQIVQFLGNVEDVPSLLKATDILCHPSLNDGIPNSIIEALSMSVPVLASDLSGIREVITDGVSGMLFRPNDVRELILKVNTALQNDISLKKLVSKGNDIAKTKFNFQTNMDRLIVRLESELTELRGQSYDMITSPQINSSLPIGILFIMNEIRTGGEETELGILASHLDGRRFQMSVLSCYDSDETTPVLEKLGYWNIDVDMACHNIENTDGKIHYIIDKIKREDIGIVVACQDSMIAYESCRRISRDECRLIEHGGIIEDADRHPKDITARYIGVSRQITEKASSVMNNPEHAVFIPSMVDTDEYDRPEWATARSITGNWIKQSLLEPYGYSENACIVVFVGRLDPKKRVEELIKAAGNLHEECPEALFLVVGGHDAYQPDYAIKIKEDAKDLVKKHCLVFTGPRSDVPGILSACDILVLPSVGEGMAHVINEAGAAGLAVVATDDGAAREQLEDGNCGCIVPPGNTNELISSLRVLIKSKNLRQTLGERLRKKVKKEYSAREVIKQWDKIFTEVAGELNKPPRVRRILPDKKLSFPKEIQIQTTTSCNASCIMCPHSTISQELPMGRMEESLFREILKQCAHEPELTRIEPFLMNEPFADRRMIKWIKMAHEMVPHARIEVTTNGALLKPEISDKLVSSGLESIWFSFNGASPETFEKIMGISYSTVMDNIKYLLSIKPVDLNVNINMIETNIMEEEIERNIAFWRSQGLDVGTSPLVNRGGNVSNFKELNYMPVNNKPIRVCELIFNKMFILYNGDVVLCCMDWRRQVVLGNVKNQSLKEIWQGEEYNYIRRKIIKRQTDDLELCSNCSYICS